MCQGLGQTKHYEISEIDRREGGQEREGEARERERESERPGATRSDRVLSLYYYCQYGCLQYHYIIRASDPIYTYMYTCNNNNTNDNDNNDDNYNNDNDNNNNSNDNVNDKYVYIYIYTHTYTYVYRFGATLLALPFPSLSRFQTLSVSVNQWIVNSYKNQLLTDDYIA